MRGAVPRLDRMEQHREPRWQVAAQGAMAGIIGAACMTVVRSAARRAGLIEKTVPQVIEEHLTAPLRRGSADAPHAHGALEQVMHLGYGAVMGAAYGLARGDRERSLVKSTLAIGVGAWLLGGMLVIPLMRAGRPTWRRTATENAVDLVAHLAYGLAAELTTDDLQSHTEPAEVSSDERDTAHTG